MSVTCFDLGFEKLCTCDGKMCLEVIITEQPAAGE